MDPLIEIRFLDAGQGDCTIIRMVDDSIIMIDCGSIKSKGVVSKTIIEAIAGVIKGGSTKKNSKVIDLVILTHADQDHYNVLKDVDAAGYYFKKIRYGCHYSLYANQPDHNFTYDLLSTSKVAAPISFGAMYAAELMRSTRNNVDSVLTLLAANVTGDPGNDKKTNDNSIVCMLECAGFKFFLMGDALKSTEDLILSTLKTSGQLSLLKRVKNCDSILKMGHHGSDSSTGDAWIQMIQPSFVLASADELKFGGSKGHPVKSHFEAIAAQCQLKTGRHNHSIVLYDDNQNTADFVQTDNVTDGRCTCLYSRNPPLGGTWAFWVVVGNQTANLYSGSTQGVK